MTAGRVLSGPATEAIGSYAVMEVAGEILVRV
jgi:hypothetical protein